MEWWSLSIFKGSRTQTTNCRIFCQDGHGVMNVHFSLARIFYRQSFLDRVLSVFRTHFVATTVCTTGSVDALTCCTHIFLRTSRSLRTSHTSHACHIHALLKCLSKRCVAHVSYFSISPSPFSCFTRLCCSCTPSLTSPFKSTTLPYFPILKAQDTRNFAHASRSLATGYEPKEFDNITSVDSDTMLIDDPDLDEISDFSKIIHENTGLFGGLTIFLILCFARFSWWLCSSNRRQTEHAIGKPIARQREKGKRRFCDQCCRVDVKEKSTEQK